MVELLAPGVYTLETSFRARSIQGVGTSTTGFAALARNGPVGGPPRLITSFAEFERIYGGLEDLSMDALGGAPAINFGAYAVRHFFAEQGARVYVSRAYAPRDPNDPDDGKAKVSLRKDNTVEVGFKSRFPGSGTDGTLEVAEAVSPATDVAISEAPVGSMARTRGAAALPASLAASAPPAPLSDGDQLVIDVNNAGAETLTFNGTQAVAEGQAQITFPVAFANATKTVVITADGMRQVVPLPDSAGSAAALSNAINASLQNARASVSNGTLRITSDAAGSAVAVTVETNTDLGFTADVTASGTGVARLNAIGAADINAALAAANVADARAITAPGGALVLETTTTGADKEIDISATDAAVRAKLGFVGETATGQAGTARTYYIRMSKAAAGWSRYTLPNSGNWTEDAQDVDPSAALSDEDYIVLVNFTFTNADGIEVAYEDMSLEKTHGRYIGARMAPTPAGKSDPLGDPLILVSSGLNAAEFHAQLFRGADPVGNDVLSQRHVLTNGHDGALPPPADWEKALDNLDTYDDIAIVAAPGSSAYALIDVPMRKALERHARNSGYRIAVLDTPPNQDLPSVRKTRGEIDSTYAAMYAPWIRVTNPLARPGNETREREINVPPSGHICGIYARNDQLRGVHKTPANEVISSALGFETEYNQAQQAVLNPIGINCLRALKGRGNRVYGGRLATSDREVLYVSDRRYLNFIKRSIYESMQWAVFEPNGPVLWANVRQAVQSFLYNQWFNNALFGTSPEEAYFVVCDGTVITQADLDNGRMICEVGLALLKPAEFVVFRIGQKTADARR